MDNETGFYNYKNRLYDSVIGSFIHPDRAFSTDLGCNIPIALANVEYYEYYFNPQGHNRYAYCFNNPLRYVDSSGLWGKDLHDYTAKIDKGWTFPINPFSFHIHFATQTSACEMINDALANYDGKAFAQGVHALQDSFNPAHARGPISHLLESIAFGLGLGPNPDAMMIGDTIRPEAQKAISAGYGAVIGGMVEYNKWTTDQQKQFAKGWNKATETNWTEICKKAMNALGIDEHDLDLQKHAGGIGGYGLGGLGGNAGNSGGISPNERSGFHSEGTNYNGRW